VAFLAQKTLTFVEHVIYTVFIYGKVDTVWKAIRQWQLSLGCLIPIALVKKIWTEHGKLWRAFLIAIQKVKISTSLMCKLI
jgi:hypothetical protein